MLVLSATLQLVQTHNLCSLLMKLAEVCLSVYRVLFFQITQKIRHLELQYCTFFTLLLYTCKLHELILLDFLPSCYILDNQVIPPGKCFLSPTCPGTSFVKNICRTLCIPLRNSCFYGIGYYIVTNFLGRLNLRDLISPGLSSRFKAIYSTVQAEVPSKIAISTNPALFGKPVLTARPELNEL